MRLLYLTHPACLLHDTGRRHPERPTRLEAVEAGARASGLEVVPAQARLATPSDLATVHGPDYIAAIEKLCRTGGGALDPDTVVSEASWEAALAAAGAGLTAVEHLIGGFDGPALAAVRPPGHHALAARAMGFCLFNNLAVTAAVLRTAGHRVAVLDWDVHHGNGTQSMFFSDPDVLYVSLHQSPFYPYEGGLDEVGEGAGTGTTLNVPLPALTAGDVYLQAISTIVAPALRAFAPDWVLVSAGFDAHAEDPLAEMSLVAADYGVVAATLAEIVPPRRIVLFLEGGYHLAAIGDSVASALRGLDGQPTLVDTIQHLSPDGSRQALEAAWHFHRARWDL